MWIHATCRLNFDLPAATPFLFMLRPRSGWQQWVGRDQYIMNPTITLVELADPFDNFCQRVVAPPGRFSVKTSVDVQCAESSDAAPGADFVEVQRLPEDALPFLLPSRYCESDRFGRLATDIVAGYRPGYDQCAAIVDHIRRTIRYSPGTGGDIVSACEVNGRSEAVCRDMAHLGVACCHAIAILARMVVGYLEDLQAMDLHAWFEAYVGGRWCTFDPTRDTLHGARVAIAYGRDAADVAIYTQFGEPVELLDMEVTVGQTHPP